MKKEIKVFCTGGWDSTFMLCKLSREAIILTPIYVLNSRRQSRDRELDAIKSIIKLLSDHPDTKAVFSDLEIINLSNLEINPDIRAARRRLANQVGLLGYQYDYLATIAQKYDFVGLGLEKTPGEIAIGATATLSRFAQLKKTQYGCIIDQSRSSSDINVVFGHMFFPIIDITEPEMVQWAKKHSYEDIMKLSWFCHSPINKQPCGLCRPCEEKMDSNMAFLLPCQAQKRYLKAKKWRIFGDKISRSIKNFKIRLLSSKTKD